MNFGCVSVIRGLMRIISQMWTVYNTCINFVWTDLVNEIGENTFHFIIINVVIL